MVCRFKKRSRRVPVAFPRHGRIVSPRCVVPYLFAQGSHFILRERFSSSQLLDVPIKSCYIQGHVVLLSGDIVDTLQLTTCNSTSWP